MLLPETISLRFATEFRCACRGAIGLPSEVGESSDPMETLRAFHVAYAPEMRAFYRSFPIASDNRVLDVGCGEGIGSKWLGESVGPRGDVVGADLSLRRLTKAAADRDRPTNVWFCCSDAYRMPFPAGTFDVACCSHSLITLRDTPALLAEAIRVVRRGGRVIFIEMDAMHEAILPWPVELEIELQTAIYQEHLSRATDPARHYLGRRLPELLCRAGMTNVYSLPCAISRVSPFDPDVRRHLVCLVRDLRSSAARHLSPCLMARFDELTSQEGPFLNEPGIGLTLIDWAIIGEKASAQESVV
jgi:ubiquinone/menaquinone biosynthesis C-methylase UbiE